MRLVYRPTVPAAMLPFALTIREAGARRAVLTMQVWVTPASMPYDAPHPVRQGDAAGDLHRGGGLLDGAIAGFVPRDRADDPGSWRGALELARDGEGEWEHGDGGLHAGRAVALARATFSVTRR